MKKQKLTPDAVLKNYWNNNEQFADLFNAALFDRKTLIMADELEDVNTEESVIFEHKKILIEARENNLALHNVNNKDLFNLLEILLDTETPKHKVKERAIQYSEDHCTEKNVIMTVVGATNIKLDYNLFQKGDGRMCTVFDEIAKEGEDKGIVETGFEFGLSESDILERLQKKLDVSLQMAQEYLVMFGKQTL